MTTIKLKGLDRCLPRLIYRLDKIGLKMRSRRILRIGCRLSDYIGVKYGAPRDREWMLWMDCIQFEE